jgi:hypothetical protein
VLVLILNDMANLYLASYTASESHLVLLSKKSGSSANEAATPTSPSSSVAKEWSASEASSVVAQLLGGALQCLIDCRYAFTSAVLER